MANKKFNPPRSKHSQIAAAQGKVRIAQNNANMMLQRLQDINGVEASQTLLSGQYMVNAAGEAKVDVYFPVKFIEKPLVSFGFEMKDGEPYVPGQMASATAVVLDWKTEERPPVNRFYTGFTLGVVNTGIMSQKIIGIWHASGIAFTNPAGD